MKRGIFFTILFGAFFLLVLSLLLFYTASISQRDNSLSENTKIQKYALITDDLSADLLKFLKIHKISITRNNTHAIISINQTIPLGFANPNLEVDEFEFFFENNYANKNNLNGMIKLDLTRFAISPTISFPLSNFEYSYTDLNKVGNYFKGTNTISGYSFEISSVDENFINCGWTLQAAGSISVSINLTNSLCPLQTFLLDPAVENKFYAITSSGKVLNASFGFVDGSGYSMKLLANSLQVNLIQNITYYSSVQEKALLNAGIAFNNSHSLDSLTLFEN